MYYDWSKIEGYHCPVKIVVARRGIGKTFTKVRQAAENFITKHERFVYVVETGDMVKELCRNNGDKFWSAIVNYYSECNTSKKRYFFDKLTNLKLEGDEEENGNSKVFKRKAKANLCGGTIRINDETAGYILDMNSFGEIKRNNFDGVGTIIIDEFISEKLDKTTLDNPRKISSIIQSVSRLRDVKVYLLGNSVRLDDPILARIGFKITKYGFYRKYDENGLVAILHFVDPADYPEFEVAHNKSVAGRFANLMQETNEETNKFASDLPEDRRLNTFKYKKNGLSINLVKDDVIVTVKQLENGNYACIPFANRNTKNLFCLTEKEQGFKYGYHIICNLALRKTLLDMIKANIIYYYTEIEYTQLKFILKGV